MISQLQGEPFCVRDREAASTLCFHILPVSQLLDSLGCVPFITAGWTTAYDSGLRPDREVGAALFPAVSGSGGARLRVNLGLDRARPLRFPPQWMADEGREQVAAALRAACRPPDAAGARHSLQWTAGTQLVPAVQLFLLGNQNLPTCACAQGTAFRHELCCPVACRDAILPRI